MPTLSSKQQEKIKVERSLEEKQECEHHFLIEKRETFVRRHAIGR